MKIEVGGQYKTRNGRKAVILGASPFVGNTSHHSLVGVVDGNEFPRAWNESGKYIAGGTSSFDLIEVWSDPPTAIEVCKEMRQFWGLPASSYSPPFSRIIERLDCVIAAEEAK